MGGTKTYYLVLAFSFAVSVVALILVLFSKKTNTTQFYLSNEDKLNPNMVKFINLLGGDIMAIVPKNLQKKSVESKEIDEVFKASGNPWEVTKLEFYVLRLSYGFIGFAIAVLFAYILKTGLPIAVGLAGIMTFLGWNRPISQYRKIAKVREREFKKFFPEFLDYLTMIMGDGTNTFANAIEISVPYLLDSTVKEEFERVSESINAGMNTDTALTLLADRIPTPALQAFVQAVNNANKLNTPMDGLMRNRAKQSREDLRNDMELVIQSLPNKTMLTTAPVAILAIILIALVPVFMELLTSI